MMASTPGEEPTFKGRTCGVCSMCCKVFAVPEIPKKADVWCQHASPGKGCSIHADRPPVCRGFFCGYLHWPDAADHWFPAKSKMVLTIDADTLDITVNVDKSAPVAWRAEPYYGDIKRWAVEAAQDNRQVQVVVGNRRFLILPDRDVDQGLVAADELVFFGRMPDGSIDVVKVKPDDPRAAELRSGKKSGG